MRFPPHSFLVTARHVVEEAGLTALYVPSASGLLEVTGDFVGATEPAGEVKALDVAFRRLPAALVAALGADRFLERDNIEPWTARHPGRHLLIVGYPSSKVKANPHAAELRYEPFPFASMTKTQDELESHGYRPGYHLAAEFDKEWSVRDAKRTPAPHPIGMSGAGMFGFQSLMLPDADQDPLVGILTTWRREPPLSLVGTDIGVVTEGIFQTFPECDFRRGRS
jgi:hypothetical protein